MLGKIVNDDEIHQRDRGREISFRTLILFVPSKSTSATCGDDRVLQPFGG
jgi:hypothetical protein